MRRLETLLPKLDKALKKPKNRSGEVLVLQDSSQVVFRSDSHDSKGQSIDPQLDSALLYTTYTVAGALHSLLSTEVTGTTKRELFDRTLRAVGKQTLAGNLPYDAYAKVENASRNFYRDYHSFGKSPLITLEPGVSEAVSQTPIARDNRNLAASIWEKQIQDKAYEEATLYYDQYTDLQPVVVSVAFGGSEPALFLSSLLQDCPVVNLRIDKDANTHSYLKEDTISGENAVFFVVDDTKKSGSTLSYAEQAVKQDFQPQVMRSVIIKDFSNTSHPQR
jgi:hypothetical protein